MNRTRGPVRWVQLWHRDEPRPNTSQLGKAGSLALLLALNAGAQNAAVLEPPEVTAPEVVAVASAPYTHPAFATGLSLETGSATAARALNGASRESESSFLWQENTWFGAFEPTLRKGSAELRYVNLSPGFSSGFGALDLGAGVDMLWLDSGWRDFYQWVRATQPDKPVQADSEVIGLGASVGVNLHLTERQEIGVSYRRPVNIDYRGELQLYSGSPVLGGGMFRNEIRTQLKFPTIVAAGYGLSITDKIWLKADVEWLQYSKLKDLALMVANGIPGLPGSVNEMWQDTFALRAGGQYRLGEHWALRAGYQFYKSPVQDAAYSSTPANADQNLITLGVAFNHRSHALEATYGANFHDSRSLMGSSDAAFSRDESGPMHLFSFTYRLVF